MECFHGGSGYWSYIMCAFVESVCEQYLGSTSGCISIFVFFKYDALLVSFPALPTCNCTAGWGLRIRLLYFNVTQCSLVPRPSITANTMEGLVKLLRRMTSGTRWEA